MHQGGSGNSAADFAIYFFTVVGVFISENWYLILMVVLGVVHAIVALHRNAREKELHRLRIQRLIRAGATTKRFDDDLDM